MRPGPPSPSRRRPARRQQHQHPYNITSNRRRHHHYQQHHHPHHHHHHHHHHHSHHQLNYHQYNHHHYHHLQQQYHHHQHHHLHYRILGDIGSVNTWAILFLLLLVSGPCLALIETSYNQLDHLESRRIDQQGTTKSSLLDRANRKPRNLTIGYLTAIKGGLKDRQGLAISGAISMALDEINNDPHILPDVRLVMRWNDTRGETVDATRAMVDMICDGVAAFFGPEGSCYVEAIVAQSRNIPMISYIPQIPPNSSQYLALIAAVYRLTNYGRSQA